MLRKFIDHLGLAQKFYLTLVLPLIVISALVTWVTYQGLRSNADELADALKVQGKANGVLSLLLTQDDASKALLIDPSQLELFSGKKISAYDDHKKLLAELSKDASSDAMRQLLKEITTLDEITLRPVDTAILEKLFENPDAARALYFTDYEPHRAVYESKIRELARLGTAVAESGRLEMTRKNTQSLLQITLALILGIGVVATTITILSRQVQRSEENTKSLLAVLSEGLFFFDSAGAILAERSQALSRIIPGSGHVQTLYEFMAKYSNVSESNVKTCLNLLWSTGANDFLSDFDSSVSFLPSSTSVMQ
ncbi:MAG: hypothetical protein NTV34_16075 [Proteobacteria bacterium]|nr:hypothetical protein [Pseudomonadota bacterium]